MRSSEKQRGKVGVENGMEDVETIQRRKKKKKMTHRSYSK